jgi:hypothetical protein
MAAQETRKVDGTTDTQHSTRKHPAQDGRYAHQHAAHTQAACLNSTSTHAVKSGGSREPNSAKCRIHSVPKHSAQNTRKGPNGFKFPQFDGTARYQEGRECRTKRMTREGRRARRRQVQARHRPTARSSATIASETWAPKTAIQTSNTHVAVPPEQEAKSTEHEHRTTNAH